MTQAAFSWFTPARCLLPAIVLAVTGLRPRPTLVVFLRLRSSCARVSALGSSFFAVLDHFAQRPADPWPRWTGDVLLGRPGDPDFAKGWIEPGGSFSPTYNSFGISFWEAGDDGVPLATSDNLPLAQTMARYLNHLGAKLATHKP